MTKTPWKNRLKSDRPRPKDDFYETPIELCKASVERFFVDEGAYNCTEIIDPGAGTGVWGKSLLNRAINSYILTGIELIESKKPDGYYEWWVGDFLNYPEYDDNTYNSLRPKLSIGNPPYSLAEEFIRKSLSLIERGGYVYFLLRLAFLESMRRGRGLFQEFPPKRIYVLMRRPSFFSVNGKRTTDALSYAMFLWQKGYNGKTELAWLDWNYEN